MTSDLLLGVLELRGGSLVFSMVNPAICDATGFDEASLMGRTLDVLDPEPATPPLAEQFRAAYARGELLRPELRCHAADGRPLVLGLTLIPDRDGDVIRAVVIGRDVTEAQRQREQEARVQGLLAKVFPWSTPRSTSPTSTGASCSATPPSSGCSARSRAR